MTKKFFAASLAVAIGAGSGFVINAYAQGKPEVQVKQRQAAMTLQSKYWGPLGGMAQGKIPYNADVVARNSGYLGTLSHMAWDGFTADTKGEKTKALPAIWDEPAKFKEAQDHFQAAVAKLAAVPKGDEAAFKSAAGEVGKACGGCHREFRAK